MFALKNSVRRIKQVLSLRSAPEFQGLEWRLQEAPPRFIDCMELEERTLLSGTPLGVEALANTTAADVQATFAEAPQAVASDSSGNFVVVWSSLNQDGSGYGVYGQRYNAAGAAQGGEFLINTDLTGNQQYAAVAMAADGRFVVAWSTDVGGDPGVRAQRFDAAGVAQGGQIQVNTNTTNDQLYGGVAMDSNGNFVVTWSSINQDTSGYGIFAQRFDSTGAYVGGEFQVNTTVANDQIYSQVAMDATGDFVIVWESAGQDGSGRGIYGQRYNSAGVAQGGEFLINTTTAGDQTRASVSMNANGDFGVTWTSADSSGTGIYARAFNSAGAPIWAESRINTTTAGDQDYSSLTVSPNGEAIVVWSSFGQDDATSWGVYAQKFTAFATPEDGEFRVNSTTAGDQRFASVALTDAGNAVFAWSGNGPGDGDGVFMQRYLFSYKPVVTATGSALAYTENAGALAVDGGIVVADSDSTQLQSATVTISGNYVNGEDVLAFTNQNGITGSWDAGTGRLTLSGTSSVANYQAALRSITYTNTSDNPSTSARTVSFVVNDGVSNSLAATRNINIAAVNDAPVLGGIEGPALPYTEGGVSAITSSLAVSDLDHTMLASATVQITGNYQNGQDLLSFTNTANITGSWSAATGTLTLVGSDTLANYQAALRSVTYFNSADNPNAAIRTVTFRVNDGTNSSNTQTRDVAISAVNDAPVVTDRALVFDGVDDRVVVNGSASLQMTTAVTIEAWFMRQGTPTTTQLLVNKEGEYEVGINAAGQIQWAFANTTPGWNWVSTGYTVPVDQWTHVAVTYNAGGINTYINGTLVHSYNGSGSLGDIYPALNTLTIGARENATDQRFQGLIDEVRIWNTARSGAEIAANFDQALSGAEAGLVGYWRFAETGGNVALDSSSQANHGILGNGIAAQMPTRLHNFTLSEDGSLNVGAMGVLATASDAEGSPLTAVLVTGPANASSFSLNPDGSFNYVPTANFSGTDSFVFRANDGALNSRFATVYLNVLPLNDPNIAPTVTVPAQQTSQLPTLVFSSAQGNAIIVSDADANGGMMELTLAATNGTFTLGSAGGISFLQGDGTGDATLQIRGTLAALNNALDGLQFAAADTSAQLAISVSDLGNTGTGGAATASAQIDIAQVPLAPPAPPDGDSGNDASDSNNSSGDNGNSTSDEGEDSSPADNGSAAAIPPIPPRGQADGNAALWQPASRAALGGAPAIVVADASMTLGRTFHDAGAELVAADSNDLLFGQGRRGQDFDGSSNSSRDDDFQEQALWRELRKLNESLEEVYISPWSYGAIAGLGALSAGYMLYGFQAGSLMTSALSSLPVWGSFDPLPVLEFWERDSKRKEQQRSEEDDPFLQAEPETTPG
jgi:hypothetical protein